MKRYVEIIKMKQIVRFFMRKMTENNILKYLYLNNDLKKKSPQQIQLSDAPHKNLELE